MDSAKKECPSWNLHRTRIACIRIPFRFTGTQHWPQKMLTRCQFFIPRDGPRGRHTFSQERKNDGTVLPFRQLTKPLSPVSRAFIVQPFQLTFSLHNFNVQIFRRSLFSYWKNSNNFSTSCVRFCISLTLRGAVAFVKGGNTCKILNKLIFFSSSTARATYWKKWVLRGYRRTVIWRWNCWLIRKSLQAWNF